MPWYEDCPLTRKDFEDILGFLFVLRNKTEEENKRLEELLQSLLKWLAS